MIASSLRESADLVEPFGSTAARALRNSPRTVSFNEHALSGVSRTASSSTDFNRLGIESKLSFSQLNRLF
ncbi:MAG: hypothetical protein WAS05_03915 [Candidatus Nanopelagicales bacterium]